MDSSSDFNCDFDFGSKLNWNKTLKKIDFVIFLDYWDFILKDTPVCDSGPRSLHCTHIVNAVTEATHVWGRAVFKNQQKSEDGRGRAALFGRQESWNKF